MRTIWQKIRVGLAVVVAVVACPCHLPLTLPLLLAASGGTLLGFSAGTAMVPLFIASTVLFIGALYFSVLWINSRAKAPVCKTRTSRVTRRSA